MSRAQTRRDEARATNRCHQTAAKPRHPSPHGTRLPEYVTVLWAREQLRARIQSNNTALAAELQYSGRQRHGRRAEPNAAPEAEL
jgi:hypothetical protein